MTIRTIYTGRICRLLCILLAVVMAIGPSASVLAQTAQAVRQRAGEVGDATPADDRSRTSGDTTLVAAPDAAKIDTTFVAPGAVALVVLRPAQIMTSPVTEMLPREIATAAGLKFLGFDPADVDEVVAFADMTNPMAPPAYGLTVSFNKPFKGASIPQELRAHAQLGELNGKKYLQSQHPFMPSFYGPNNKTLVIAPDATLRQIVEGTGESKSGPIIDRVRDVPAGSDLYVVIDIASVRPLLQMAMAQGAAQLPPDVQPLLELPNLIAAAELTVNLTNSAETSFVVHANDEAAADQLITTIQQISAKQQERIKAQFAAQAASDDPIERAFAQYMERISTTWNKPVEPIREGATLTFFRSQLGGDSQNPMVMAAVGGILIALLLPAVQAAREAARRNQAINNLKHMMLAFLNHHDTKGTLPAHANYDAEGKPLLSWRVHILPFIEEQQLYSEFHLDEPWDSEHNRALLARMPEVYKSPNHTGDPTKTNYLAVVGEGCVVDGTDKGTNIRDITDGTSKTVVLVEADEEQAVEWTKPDDLEYNPEQPMAGLGNLRPGGFNAGYSDGSVRFISNSIDLEALKAIFTRAGGEQVDAF